MEATAVSKKLRGGYYTPLPVARWLTRWAIRSETDRVLEPSCGDGAFLEAAASELASRGGLWRADSAQLVGVELVPQEAEKARAAASRHLAAEKFDVVQSDFFTWYRKARDESFDVVIGNPPFIRYQNFPEPARAHAMALMEASGLRANRLTNIWVPFVVAAVTMLRAGGRLAMVIPAELLQVTYAAQLRRFLADSFGTITIYACNEMLFAGAEQEVVLLLADSKVEFADESNKCDITLVETESVSELLRKAARKRTKPSDRKLVEHTTEKWLKYFLDADEIALMRSLRTNERVGTLRDHGEVDVGVVTGSNDFFVLTGKQVADHEAEKFVVPLVGRSSQLPGAFLHQKDHKQLVASGKPVFLLDLNGRSRSEFTPGVRRLVAMGEERGVHLGYKCSIRQAWYAVPSIWEPDCFLFRQIHDFPRAVVNRAGATSTDTIHRFRCSSRPARVASNMYTYLTAASAEIEGRSYGGGVLELEPTEAERLLMPKLLNGAMPLEDVDRNVRDGRLEAVLAHNDKVVLQESLGLTKTDCRRLKRIWVKMRDRRMSRRRS